MARNKWIHVDDINRLDASKWQEITRTAYDLKFEKLTTKTKKETAEKTASL